MAAREIETIGVTTGGGDAPGLNAVIRAVVKSALRRGWKVIGIERGYNGIFDHRQTRRLTGNSVRGITHIGGSILGTNSKGNPFKEMVERDGEKVELDRTPLALEGIQQLGLDAIVAIGGDGSMRLAEHLHRHGVPIVGVPKTIDNDLSETVVTFGFDTAVAIAADAIDRIATTAEAHERLMLVEVMGRNQGWIALHAGMAAGADVILIPEVPYDLDAVAQLIRARSARGRPFSIVVVAEGVPPPPGREPQLARDAYGFERLGGVAYQIAPELEERTGIEARVTVLGYVQRGGTPTAFDRVLATRLGVAAADLAAQGEGGVMVAVQGTEIVPVPIADACLQAKQVPRELYDVAATFFG